MKKLYFFFMLLVIPVLCFPVEDNKTNTFVTEGRIWNVEYANDHYKTEMYYAFIGDTVIEGKLYNKLYEIGDTTLTFPRTTKDYYIGGYREEDGRVWFRPGIESQYCMLKEVLVYDFTIKPGDEFLIETYSVGSNSGPGLIEFHGPYESFVTVGEITKDSQSCRRFNISVDGLVREWIEGVGGYAGLFWDNITYLSCCVGQTATAQLMCVKQEEKVLYLNNPNCDRCFCKTISNIPENPQNKIRVNVFPNPVKDNLNVTISEEMLPCMMNLYSPTGDFVTGKRITEVSETVNMKGQETGLYLYRVTTDGGELLNSGKIIKK